MPEKSQLNVSIVTDAVYTAMGQSETGRMQNVWGPATGGKSRVLAEIARRARDDGSRVLWVKPPTGSMDAAAYAFVQTTEALVRAQVINGESKQLRARSGWAAKNSDLKEWLSGIKNDTVVLVDSPNEWGSSRVDGHFAERAEDVWRTLLGATLPHRVVIAGRVPQGVVCQTHHLGTGTDLDAWRRATDPLEGLLLDRLGDELSTLSALDLALLHAIAILSSGKEAGYWWQVKQPSRRELVGRLVDLVSELPNDFLRLAWSRLSLVRGTLPVEPTSFVGKAPDEKSDWILQNCLLDQGRETLHWVLRLDASQRLRWSGLADEKAGHAALARIYQDRFEAEQDTGQELLSEYEAFHHATRAGEPARSPLSPFFADQLNALGRTLSMERRDHEAAAEVFERASLWDPSDDYAHHYRAYNLDILGKEPAKVEESYRRAIELNGRHAWWWSRFVCFLVTRGRTKDALTEWKRAQDALMLDADTSDEVYFHLHRWLARLLVHRGLLDFAERVLVGVPEHIKKESWFGAIDRHRRVLGEGEEERAIVPLHWPIDCWSEGPFLLAARSGHERRHLSKWLAARLSLREEGRLYFSAGNLDVQPTEYLSFDISEEDFSAWSLDSASEELAAGTFVELGWYGDDVPEIRIHKTREWHDPDLPRLVPDPARYLRAAGWVA